MINLLVTGGCGFIGSNFINYIFPKDLYNIVNVDSINYCSNIDNISDQIRPHPNYILYQENINNQPKMLQILSDHKIDIVIHFAAQSHVQNSFDDSLLFTQDNVVGTHNLIEAARKYGKLQKFIHISTDEVYGESCLGEKEQKKDEFSVLSPTNPYAATKAAAEMLVSSYHKSFGVPVIITRGNNVYGFNQYPEKIIPKFINLLIQNKKVTIQGDGSAVRGFLHVFDTARAVERIIEDGLVGEIYNIGCEDTDEYTVEQIAHILIDIIKKSHGSSEINYDEYIEYIEDRPFNDQRYYISNKKIKQLGWLPSVDFSEGIHALVDHEKNKRIFTTNK